MTGRWRVVTGTLRLVSLASLFIGFQHMTSVMNDIQHQQRQTEVVFELQTHTNNSISSNSLQDEHRYLPMSGITSEGQEMPEMKNTTREGQWPTINATNTTVNTIRTRRKRKRGRRRRRDKSEQNNDDDEEEEIEPPPLKVPLPIFVPSLPKSGTTTVHKYFRCGGQRSAHHIYRIDGQVKNKIGRCVKRNIKNGLLPFQGCGRYDIWTDTGK